MAWLDRFIGVAASLALGLGLGCGEVVKADGGDAGTTTTCEMSSECTLEAPVCEEASATCRGCADESECSDAPGSGELCHPNGQCVECIAQSDCGAQACDPDTFSCRACQEHSECDSEICDREAGACVEESGIIYVDNDNGEPGSCTKEQPCKDVGTASALFSSDREWMRVRPASEPYQTFGVVGYNNAHVCADGAVFDLDDAGGEHQPFFKVLGGGRLAVEGGTYKNSSVTAFECVLPLGTSGALRISEVTIDSVVHAAWAHGCILEIRDSNIVGSSDVAIIHDDVESFVTDMVVERNRIIGGGAGAIYFAGDEGQIRNNVMIGNFMGEPSLYRVIDLGFSVEVSIVNNTIMGNAGLPDDLPPPEGSREDVVVWCAGGAEEGIAIANNIMWGNPQLGMFIECEFGGNPIVANILDVPDEDKERYPGNFFMAPKLESPLDGDVTPTEDSPALDAASADFAPDDDLLGNPRPVGEGPDIGAVERP